MASILYKGKLSDVIQASFPPKTTLLFNGINTLSDILGFDVSAVDNTVASSTGAILDGSGDYLTIPHLANPYSADTDFTCESILTPTTLKRQAIVNKRGLSSGASANSEWSLYFNASNQLQLTTWNTALGAYLDLIGTNTVIVSTEYHVAFTREGNTWRIFLNGILQGSTSSATGTYRVNTTNVVIGRDVADNGRDFQGVIKQVRITKECLYSASFTPPTTLI